MKKRSQFVGESGKVYDAEYIINKTGCSHPTAYRRIDKANEGKLDETDILNLPRGCCKKRKHERAARNKDNVLEQMRLVMSGEMSCNDFLKG